MGYNPNFFNPSYTSSALEHNVILRLRAKLTILPNNCTIERQLWGTSTSLVFDFQQCPQHLAFCQDHIPLILGISHDLGLSNTIVLRLGNKILHWQTLTPPESSANA
jgi:hypothetical protein